MQKCTTTLGYLAISFLVLSIWTLGPINTHAQIQDRCQVTLEKQADPADGTEFEAQFFSGNVLFAQDTIINGLTINVSFENVGQTLRLTESVPDGWRIADIICTNPVNINVGPFENGSVELECLLNQGQDSSVECTLVNTTSCGVEVTKVSQLSADFPFEFNAPGSDNPTFTLQDPSADSITVSIPPGETVDITENVPSAWTLEGIECTQAPGISSSPIENGVSVSCDSANLIECTFTNSFTRNVPTLNEWGLIALAVVLGLVGFMVIRKRKLVS